MSVSIVVAACGGTTPTPTPVPTPIPALTPAPSPTAAPTPSAVTSAQVCADLAAFQAALDALTGIDLESAGARDVLGVVGTAITTGLAFVESARTAFGPEAQALGDALAGLQTALQGIAGEGTLGDKAAAVENAVDEVAAAFDALKANVSPGCSGPEASGEVSEG
jgi:hypothetical protein